MPNFVRAAGLWLAERITPPNAWRLRIRAGRGRGGQQPVLADHDPPEAVRRGHLEDDLRRGPVVVAAIAADDQGLAFDALEHVEHRLDEVLQVVRLWNTWTFLRRPAGALVLERAGGDGVHAHQAILIEAFG